jgi:hypothetical protein
LTVYLSIIGSTEFILQKKKKRFLCESSWTDTGKREIHPPGSLIDQLLRRDQKKPNVIMPMSKEPGSSTTQNTEATIADLFIIMERANEESRKRHEQTFQSIAECKTMCISDITRIKE